MSHHLKMVCAGALLCAAIGCTLDSFLVSITPGPGKTRYVAGSVDQVSTNLQAALSNVGIAATVTRQSGEARVAGVTRSGRKFALVLKQQYAAGGPRTSVSVEWEGEADEQFWLTVVEMLTTKTPKTSTSTSGS